MARKKVKRGKKNKAIPVAVVAPVAMPFVSFVAPKLMAGDFKGAGQSMAQEYVGLNPDSTFNAKQIAQWAIPTMVGVIVHKGANKFGVNRYVRKATMGFLEL